MTSRLQSLFVCLALLGLGICAPARADTDLILDDYDPSFDGTVSCIAGEMGRYHVSGSFTTVNSQSRPYMALIQPNETLGQFGLLVSLAQGFATSPFGFVRDDSGRILTGGSYFDYWTQKRHYLSRLSATGGRDSAVASNTTWVNVMHLAQGKFYMAAQFTNGLRVVRMNYDSSFTGTNYDAGFTSATINGSVSCMLLLADGRLVIGGSFSQVNGVARTNLAVLKADGTLDAFNMKAVGGPVSALAAGSAGGVPVVYFGGGFTSVELNGSTTAAKRLFFFRPQAPAYLSSTYMPNPDDVVYALLPLPSEELVVGGKFYKVGGKSISKLALLRSDGSLSSGVVPGFHNGDVITLVYDPMDGGRVVVGGGFTQVGSVTRNRFARLIVGRAVNRQFAFPETGTVRAITQPADGKVWVGGSFASSPTLPRRHLARLLNDGTLDSTVTIDVDGQVSALASLTDGRTLIGGSFTQVGTTPAARLARLGADGSHDTTFTLTADGDVHALAARLDGSCYVAGAFMHVGGQPRTRVARIQADGTLDSGFAPTLDGVVRCVLPLPGGRVLIGGDFATVNGTPRPWLALLEADGSLDETFAPGFDGGVRCLARQKDGSLLVGGDFTGFLRRLSSSGAADTTFAASPDGLVQVICLQADSTHVLIGGSFAQVGGQASAGLARLALSDGALQSLPDLEWEASAPSIHALAVRADGSMLVGGTFSLAWTPPRSGLISLVDASQPLPPAPSFSHDAPLAHVIWQRAGAVQELSEVFFELSLNAGASWTPLGAGELTDSGWSVPAVLGQLPVDQAFQLRARGTTLAGTSSGWVQDVVTWNLKKPVVTSPPYPFSLNAGETRSLTVSTNTPGVSFQWYKDDILIPQATQASLSVTGTLAQSEAGRYHVVLTNVYGSTQSASATVTVTRLMPSIYTDTPFNATVIATLPASFAVQTPHHENIGYTYQWYQDDVLLPGATSRTLTITDTAAVASTRSYKAKVSNPVGSIFSRTAILSVTRPVPVISQEPADLTTIAGQGSDLYLRVTSPATGITHNYQWYRDDVAIPGATTDTYRVPYYQTTSAMSGLYHVVVSNLFGSDESRKATVLVRSPPVLSSYATPLGTTVATGRPVSISATAMYGGAPYTYRWQRSVYGNYDWQPVPDAATGTLELTAVDASNTGYYRLVVSNSLGTTIGASVRIQRIVFLQISQPPQNQDANGGDSLHLYASLASWDSTNAQSGQLAYQWFKDDLEIPGATKFSFNKSATEADSGNYKVRITNEAGSVTSEAAVVTVSPNTPPTILTQPQPRFIHTGEPLALTISAEGHFPMTATWRRNGARMASGIVRNKISRHERAATLADSGIYSVLLSNARGTLFSDFVPVVVVDAPARTLVRRVGSALTLPPACTAAGVTFQWLKDGGPMADSNEIKGTDKASLTFTKLALTDAQVYTCRVTKGSDSLVTGATTLVIQDQPPVITTTSLALADCGLPYRAPLAATHLPTAFEVTGLPPGLTFNATTGEISGTPTKPGAFKIEATATNTHSTGPKKVFSITVAKVPAYLTGTFFGFLPADDRSAGGRLDVTVTDAATFTGKLTLHTQVIAIKGTLKRDPEAPVAIIELTGIPHKDLGPISLSFVLGEHEFEQKAGAFTVTHAYDYQEGDLWALPWSKTVRPTAFEGYHTFHFPGSTHENPHGHSYGSATVSTAGAVAYAGRLADDTSYTASAPVSAGGVSGFFLINDGGRNHVSARIHFDKENDSLSAGLRWRKLPAENSRTYPEGFDFTSGGYGEPYAKPKTPGNPGSIVMNLEAKKDNATLHFSDTGPGMLPNAMVGGTISAANAASFPTTSQDELRNVRVTISPATGIFTVTGTHVIKITDYFDDEQVFVRPIRGSGIIVNSREALGYFLVNGIEDNEIEFWQGNLVRSGQMSLVPDPF